MSWWTAKYILILYGSEDVDKSIIWWIEFNNNIGDHYDVKIRHIDMTYIILRACPNPLSIQLISQGYEIISNSMRLQGYGINELVIEWKHVIILYTWWRHQMTLLAICAGKLPAPGEKDSDTELWCFLWAVTAWINVQNRVLLVCWHDMAHMRLWHVQWLCFFEYYTHSIQTYISKWRDVTHIS